MNPRFHAWIALACLPCVAFAKSHIIFLIAEREYQTRTTLPAFFREELKPLGFTAEFIHADDKGPGRDNLVDLEKALPKADLLFLSVRRRAPTIPQMKAIRTYVDSGKPVIGIRTSSHPFHLRGKPAPDGHALWEAFDPDILGGNYNGHHGNNARTSFTVEPTAKGHPILRGLPSSGKINSGGSLYKARPLAATTELLLHGHAEGIEENQPVAWTNRPTSGNRVFYTSLGHKDDFAEPTFRTLLVNGVHWTLKLPTPGKIQKKNPLREARLPNLLTPDDLQIELVLKEPEIANPLYIDFDERGRMWVLEYRQYPWPAGLRMVSHDKVYRNVYDPPYPPPPPHAPASPFRGRDRISIHEDTNGDGEFDSHKVFLDGLNMATAALRGRNGVFVLNPPYLLFYADANKDDQPDSLQPRVLLSGFGLEDSHSLANSLRWGPDGWIYATHGSTVTAYVRLHGKDNRPIPNGKTIHRMGQFAWRYHPGIHRFEVFAEGGGNAFGIEVDSQGRVYSGHNGGNTRGFHYVQGGYYRKTFGKHGNLSNPYAFGHFQAMAHPSAKRFTHTFEIYEGVALPERYHGRLFGVSPNLHYVVASNIQPHGSTVRTEDIDHPVRIGNDPDDKWFAPVDIQTGPDGNLYIADFHARQVAHYIAYSKGLTDPQFGRIYRIRNRKPKAHKFESAAFAKGEIPDTVIHHPNRWHRETALRILGDHRDSSHVDHFRKVLLKEDGQPALQALWALNLCGGFGTDIALQTLKHRNPHVRRWTIRLLGDQDQVTKKIASALVESAARETDPETRSQLAASARRLPTRDALPILAQLIRRPEDAKDPHIPNMVWWAIEAHAGNHAALLHFFETRANWNAHLRTDGALPQQNLIRRWALSGTQAELQACAGLLELAPDEENRDRLLRGFEKAFEGRQLPPLPESLTRALSKARGLDKLLLSLRQKDERAVNQALGILKDKDKPVGQRIQVARALGDIRILRTAPALVELLRNGRDPDIRMESILALQKINDPEIGRQLAPSFPNLPKKLQPAALNLLASRAAWAQELLQSLEKQKLVETVIDPETLAKLRLHNSKPITQVLERYFPDQKPAHEKNYPIDRHLVLAKSGGGNPKLGETLYHGKAGCGACHTLFARGGNLGPDLTPYDRNNLATMVLAIVHPDAEIREGYENLLLTTRDGRVLSGFKAEENPQVLILRGLDGQNHLVPRKEVRSLKPAGRSLMPPGLLENLDETERRHLFAYLTSTTPPK